MTKASDLSKSMSGDEEAMDSREQVHWRKAAVRAELDSMRLRGVFRSANPPKDQRAIGTKWVFKTKRNDDGSINKHKDRLVTKGFKQQRDVHYTHTYAKHPTTTHICSTLASVSNTTSHGVLVSTLCDGSRFSVQTAVIAASTQNHLSTRA